MYNGTLIDELIAAVDRAEERAHAQMHAREERAGYYTTPGSSVLEMAKREASMIGAA